MTLLHLEVPAAIFRKTGSRNMVLRDIISS